MARRRQYWILKSEPEDYSFAELVSEGKAGWDGVRNPQARNFLARMNEGDLAFFYHSGKTREIVGIMKIVGAPRRDPTQAKGDDRWVLVDVGPVKPMKVPVTLADIKGEKKLADLLLVRQSRLSVIPVTKAQFAHILAMGQTKVRL